MKIGTIAIAVGFTWFIHEFAHWLMGEYLGYSMKMTLNSVSPLYNQQPQETHRHLISAAGPVITLFQAILVFLVMKYRDIKLLFPFLLTCLYMRCMAALISFSFLNDEARISKDIGLGTFTLPAIICLFLFGLVYQIVKQYKFDRKFIFKTLGIIILFSSAIILLDQFYKIRII